MEKLASYLTIITTHISGIGRENAIKRFLEYHEQIGVPIVVGVEGEVDKKISGSDSTEWVYYQPNENVYIKFRNLISKIRTPYVALVCDDDFITRSMIEAACHQLENDKNIVACDGLSVFFTENKTKRSNHQYSFRQFAGLRRANSSRITSLAKRFYVHAEYFNPMVIHGVIRKATLQSVFEGIDRLPVKWFDNIAIARIVSSGSVIMLPVISNIRSEGTRIINNAPSFYEGADIGKTQLLLDQQYKGQIYSEAVQLTQVTPELRAAMDYYFIKSTGALASISDSNFPALKWISDIALKLQSYVYLYWLISTRKTIRRDVVKIRNLMKHYPI